MPDTRVETCDAYAPPPVVIISLARQGRLAAFEMENAGVVSTEVFAAIDGLTVDASTRASLGDTHLWTAGGVGCALSHIALWRRCAQGGAPLTVIEDDAVFRGDFAAEHARVLSTVPEFDFVLWGWNFDAVLEAEVTPGVSAALMAGQAALRDEIDAFRQDRRPASVLKLCKAMGVPGYTVSPAGARRMLELCLPTRSDAVTMPLTPHPIAPVTFDLSMIRAYAQIDAHVCVPPLVVTRNDWSASSIRPRDPGDIEALTAEGLRCAAAGDLQGASRALEQAAQGSDAPEPRYNLARVRLLQDRPAEAVGLLDAALAVAPGFALAHSNRAVALLALGRAQEAQAGFRCAMIIDPNLEEAKRGLAVALNALSHAAEADGRFEAAEQAAREAVALSPTGAPLVNLGVAQLRLGDPVEAEKGFRRALDLDEQDAAAHHGLAFALLNQGRWREAWPEYAWRLKTSGGLRDVAPYDPARLWDGRTLGAGPLLLTDEQGAGDTIQMATLIEELRTRPREVVLHVSRPLAHLLRSVPGVSVVPQDAPPPPYGAWLPLMSLPGVLDLDPERTPPHARLAADPVLAGRWAPRLPPGRCRIGVVWQGDPRSRVEHGRSFRLTDLEPLREAGAVLVSLQKGAGAEQLAHGGAVDLGAAYRDGDFADTAAVIANLDLVVACDTAVAHLAGALGRPVWIALGEVPDWRWLSGRDDTVWYSNARLFRRERGTPWRTVFERMACDLASQAGSPDRIDSRAECS